MHDLVEVINSTPVTTSLAIAEGTGVQHKNVMELIRTYLADLERFGRVTFETRPFETNGGTQTREIAWLNERQATLVLSYMRNSEVVREFKIRLVSKFYEMAEQLAPKTPAEALVVMAQRLVEQERRQKELEARQQKVEQRLDQIETAIDHFTIVGYAKKYLRRSITLAESQRYGRKATKLCRVMELETGEVPDPRFGAVKMYPKSVLDLIFSH